MQLEFRVVEAFLEVHGKISLTLLLDKFSVDDMNWMDLIQRKYRWRACEAWDIRVS